MNGYRLILYSETRRTGVRSITRALACTRIKKVGKFAAQAKTVIVPDVEKFPSHTACSSLSKSEIVIPVIKREQVVAVLDADSKEYDLFDETDQQYLEKIVKLIEL